MKRDDALMDLATKIFIVLLNIIVFNCANIMLRMSNFSRSVKVLMMIAGNIVIVGGTVYIMLTSGI